MDPESQNSQSGALKTHGRIAGGVPILGVIPREDISVAGPEVVSFAEPVGATGGLGGTGVLALIVLCTGVGFFADTLYDLPYVGKRTGTTAADVDFDELERRVKDLVRESSRGGLVVDRPRREGPRRRTTPGSRRPRPNDLRVPESLVIKEPEVARVVVATNGNLDTPREWLWERWLDHGRSRGRIGFEGRP